MSTVDTLLIKKIITTAARKNATDIHLTAGNNPFLRINGQLNVLSEIEVLTPEILEEVVDYFLTKEQKEILSAKKEITFVYSDSESALRFRVNIFFQKGYPMISLRLIVSGVPDSEQLNLPKVVTDFCQNRRGLVIVSGPFSSGRSTTVASLLQTINSQRSEHIVSLEKPIEYLFVNDKSIIEQREVGKDVESFANGIETLMDEDVNVVAVSEANTAAVMEYSLELAESGRLVILQMNSDSVISVLEKIISGFEEEKKIWALNVLSDVLIGIVVQRLLPGANGGMVLACEILTMTAAVRSLLKEGKFFQLTSILQTSKMEGMINLDKSLLELLKKGEITKEQALHEALDKDSFANTLKNLT
jgi:twitching motility protein PilT